VKPHYGGRRLVWEENHSSIGDPSTFHHDGLMSLLTLSVVLAKRQVLFYRVFVSIANFKGEYEKLTAN
jgi:hypothetical protein